MPVEKKNMMINKHSQSTRGVKFHDWSDIQLARIIYCTRVYVCAYESQTSLQLFSWFLFGVRKKKKQNKNKSLQDWKN